MENLLVNRLASVYEIFDWDQRQKIGEIVFENDRWVLARGSLFPDEITETLAWQVTLMLRALNSGSVVSVGPFVPADYVGHW